MEEVNRFVVMSFGFSASDFVTLARMVLRVYDEFKEAPKACEAFRNELLLFHRVLSKTASLLKYDNLILCEKDRVALSVCIQSCKELLYVQIYGAAGTPNDDPNSDFTNNEDYEQTTILYNPPNGDNRLFRGWQKKWGEKKFAAKIPKLQQAVSAHVQTLTGLQVTLNLYVKSLKLRKCWARVDLRIKYLVTINLKC